MTEGSRGKVDSAKMMAVRAERAAEGKKAMSEYEAAARKTRARTEQLKALRQAHEEAEMKAKAKSKPAAPKKRFATRIRRDKFVGAARCAAS
jgi:hypothetical protein